MKMLTSLTGDTIAVVSVIHGYGLGRYTRETNGDSPRGNPGNIIIYLGCK